MPNQTRRTSSLGAAAPAITGIKEEDTGLAAAAPPPARLSLSTAYAKLHSKAFVKQPRPPWDDTIRGVLIALVEQKRTLWHGVTKPASGIATVPDKPIDMDAVRDVANVLANHDQRFDSLCVLEKWCWLCGMLCRARRLASLIRSSPPPTWRYANALAFLGGEDEDVAELFANLLQPERFGQLCQLFATTENDREIIELTALPTVSTRKRRSERLHGTGTAEPVEPEPKMPILFAEKSADMDSVKEEPLDDYDDTQQQQHPIPAGSSALSVSQEEATTAATAPPLSSASSSHSVITAPIYYPPLVMDAPMNSPMPGTAKESGAGPGPGPGLVLGLGLGVLREKAFPESLWTEPLGDRLIAEVRKRRAFWDNGHPDFRGLTKRRDQLMQITTALQTSGILAEPHAKKLDCDSVQAKWSELQAAFRQAYKIKSRCPDFALPKFVEKMMFLEDVTRRHTPPNEPASPPSSVDSTAAASANIVGTAPIRFSDLISFSAAAAAAAAGGNGSAAAGGIPIVIATSGVNGTSDYVVQYLPSSMLPSSLESRPEGLISNGDCSSTVFGVAGPSSTSNGGGGGTVVIGPGPGQGLVTVSGPGPGPSNGSSLLCSKCREPLSSEDIKGNTPAKKSWRAFCELLAAQGEEMEADDPILASRMQLAVHEVLYNHRVALFRSKNGTGGGTTTTASPKGSQ